LRALLIGGWIAAIGGAVGVRLWNALAGPRMWGYDAWGHVAYVLFLDIYRAVPWADQGWSYFHPPLHYALADFIKSVTAGEEVVCSAEEGLRAWRNQSPDFILIDLMMEEVDAGVTLARDLKARGNTAPVYMLSSVGDELNISTSLGELGVRGIFQKPLDHETLVATIRAATS